MVLVENKESVTLVYNHLNISHHNDMHLENQIKTFGPKNKTKNQIKT